MVMVFPRIGRHLESEGYKTVTGNTNWTNGTIVNILENEKYKGMQHFKDLHLT